MWDKYTISFGTWDIYAFRRKKFKGKGKKKKIIGKEMEKERKVSK